MKNIFVINGSASENSSNQQLIHSIETQAKSFLNFAVFNNLKSLPHFEPELSVADTPKIILDFREAIEKADGILICTPEYVFSIPSGLKNAIEWCVSTTVFSEKPTALITASANGEMGHEQLQLLMKTVMAKFTTGTTLLIRGIKGKIDEQGHLIDSNTKDDLIKLITALHELLK